MDGDPVEGKPSAPRKGMTTYAEIFYSLCPQYMAMGMTYDEFWHRPTTCHKAYREAFEQRQRQAEWARWRQGAYVYDALLRVAPVMRAAFGKGHVEPGKYPEEPWPLTEKEAKTREEAKRRERYERFLKQMNAESERTAKEKAKEANDNADNG